MQEPWWKEAPSQELEVPSAGLAPAAAPHRAGAEGNLLGAASRLEGTSPGCHPCHGTATGFF